MILSFMMHELRRFIMMFDNSLLSLYGYSDDGTAELVGLREEEGAAIADLSTRCLI